MSSGGRERKSINWVSHGEPWNAAGRIQRPLATDAAAPLFLVLSAATDQREEQARVVPEAQHGIIDQDLPVLEVAAYRDPRGWLDGGR